MQIHTKRDGTVTVKLTTHERAAFERVATLSHQIAAVEPSFGGFAEDAEHGIIGIMAKLYPSPDEPAE